MPYSRRLLRSVLRHLSPNAYQTTLPKDEFIAMARACDAYWEHSGNQQDPHVELSSGLCSNGFLYLMRMLQHPSMSQLLANELIKILPGVIDRTKIDWVVGSAYSATGLSKDVANLLGAQWMPFEKTSAGEQLWNRATFASGETILQVEDVITRGTSAFSARRALKDAGAKTGRKLESDIYLIPYVPAIAWRPSDNEQQFFQNIRAHHIFFCPLFDFRSFWALPQGQCTLCEQGSKRLKPKQKDHWEILTATKTAEQLSSQE